uniref:Protein YIF1 n=1 Tax=Ditylenchus dipsaci TaxID=166011 RepID=A0A915D7K0_9BILA
MTEPDWNWGDDLNSKSPTPYNRATPTQQPPYSQQHAPNNYYSGHQQNTSAYPQLYAQHNSFGAAPASVTDQWEDQGQWNTGVAGGGVPPAPAYSYGAGIPLTNSQPVLPTQLSRQIGGQFAEQQREKISKYLSSFHLKYYFAVDSNYVAKKIGIILFPFFIEIGPLN